MTVALERLQTLGFTEYEARAYLALLVAVDRNGYEVAKASGMPRANVYPVLERLVEHGAARRLETPGGRRYAAVPPERLLSQLETAHRHNVDEAREALDGLEAPGPETPVFNLGSRDEVLAQAEGLLAGAHKSLLVATQPTEATALVAAFAAARERGISVTTLCMDACEAECGGCVGDIHRYSLTPPNGTRWLILVADDRRMIAAELRAGATRAISTEQPLIVELAAAYIRQSIALATLCGALGDRFDGLLSAQARTIMDGLHPEGGFVARLQKMVGNKAA